MALGDDELVFVPLGGLGEIGMNAALYGFGPKGRRKWIMVDCGVAFAGDDLPGIDLLMPDIRFLEQNRKDLLGIIITHAHEDHIGALTDLWPRLQVPVFATRFAANLLEVRRFNDQGRKVPMTVVDRGGTINLGPFAIEIIGMAHSIPESCALAIRTPAGVALHTGDWKIDPTPGASWITDEKRLRELGDEGVLALICDSTNVVRGGESPSEADVGKSLTEIIGAAKNRVAVTTFASNVARIRAVAEAALANGRECIAIGRAMDRVIQVATECGYLDGLPPFRGTDAYGYLPRDKVVALLTGSQGEPRAALARVAEDQHPDVALASGDLVILSSRTIPGNEKAVGRIVNSLIRSGVEVITDRTHMVHVSGHPRRGELERMYSWVRPQVAVPVHGEPLHLDEHAKLARSLNVPQVVVAKDGDMVLLGPGKAGVVDEVPYGRLFKDGDLLISAGESTVQERRRLSFAGVVSVAIAIDGRGDLVGDPGFEITGLPQKTRTGEPFEDVIDDAIVNVLRSLPKQRRRDADLVENAVERAVRGAVGEAWGKKPTVHVHVVVV
ncbi:RNase J family beta-CASP ribonuclease [Alsobacter metallidurans]|uniref:RNase J family beta-CASP ribonuclease n=1 Tax=Alsobacter metallidurans TaxID=340221 RepID=A0A917MIH5_9HYPH|nr:ribonuclease J [Alsobacter metallidurans]GGH20549.1 RNase J family beta-CASP ribonuclease [Alsobacter metallidurans]